MTGARPSEREPRKISAPAGVLVMFTPPWGKAKFTGKVSPSVSETSIRSSGQPSFRKKTV